MAVIFMTTITNIECAKAQRDTLVIETNFGKIEAELYNDIAPKTVAHMEKLAKEDVRQSSLPSCYSRFRYSGRRPEQPSR